MKTIVLFMALAAFGATVIVQGVSRKVDFSDDAVGQQPKGFEFGYTARTGAPGIWIVEAEGANKYLAQVDADSTRSRFPVAVVRDISAADLEDQQLLLLEDGHCLRDQALDVCRMSGAEEQTGFRATSLETLRQMVGSGVGITLLPALSVQPPVAPMPGLKLLRFAEHPPSRRIALVWRRSSAFAPFLRRLAKVLAQVPRPLLSGLAIPQ